MNDIVLEFERIPFIWKPITNPQYTEDIPSSLSFKLALNTKYNLFIQVPNQIVEKTLNKAYESGSEITGMMEDTGIGKNYADDFLNFIMENQPEIVNKDLSILEIGAGTGYLLHQLKKMNPKLNVIGIEPGKHGQENIEKYGNTIIRDFFPSKYVTDKFDLIISFGVLEHIKDIERFYLDIRQHLKTNGMIVFSVPDCTSSIKNGDISMLIHEHWNYFDENSLGNFLSYFSSKKMKIQKSKFGGSLYSLIQPDDSIQGNKISNPQNFESEAKIKAYLEGFDKLKSKLINLKNKIKDKNLRLGIYVPNRIANWYSLLGFEEIQVEFFDDNKNLHNTFLPGINIVIQNRDTLINSPVDVLLIMSDTFGEKIKSEILPFLKNTEILTLSGIKNE